MTFRALFRIFTLAIGPCLFAASTQTMFAASTTSKAPAQRGPAMSDSQIDTTIRMKLAKSKIGKDGFKFKVSHGTVTWEGKTDVIQHKGSATRMAHAAGATQVINNIQISDAAKAKAANNLKNGQPAGAPKHAAVS